MTKIEKLGVIGIGRTGGRKKIAKTQSIVRFFGQLKGYSIIDKGLCIAILVSDDSGFIIISNHMIAFDSLMCYSKSEKID